MGSEQLPLEQQIYLDDPAKEEEKFDNQKLLVGNAGRTKFWELYKSDRRFKDASENSESDPRYSYFQECKNLHINPRASQIIRDKESPIIEYTNQFLNSATSVKAIAEAIKRYKYNVTHVQFVNNSIRPRDGIKIIESIETHMPNLLVLNMSKNEIGAEGGRYLAQNIPKMPKLQELRLADCNIGDRSSAEIVANLDELATCTALDLSGNKLGQSIHFGELASKMESFLNRNHLEKLLLSDNNLRSANGEKICRAICL